MRLEANEEILASREAVWARLSDFAHLEALAASRGKVTRVRDGALPIWEAQVDLLGATRDLVVRVTDMSASDSLSLVGEGSGVRADIAINLSATDDKSTLLDVSLTLKGMSFSGKALVQGLKFAQGSVQEKFRGRVRSVVRRLADGGIRHL